MTLAAAVGNCLRVSSQRLAAQSKALATTVGWLPLGVQGMRMPLEGSDISITS